MTLILLILSIIIPEAAIGQAGVLVIGGESAVPDSKKLSLDEMEVDIRIDNQLAKVRVVQIFANHTDRSLEGKYLFSIPTTASISDFAVWDGEVRIPGVILEKRSASEVYEEVMAQRIDPGILQQESEEGTPTAFAAKVAPIPAYGTKRLELEYAEMIPVDGRRSFFSFPLKPSEYGAQSAGFLRVKLQIRSNFPLSHFRLQSSAYARYPIKLIKQNEHEIDAVYEAAHIVLEEDFAFEYSIDIAKSELGFLAYRAPEKFSAADLQDPYLWGANLNPDGYFEASAIFNEADIQPDKNQPPTSVRARNLILMLDTSLSMQWEKLSKAYEAIELFLKSLNSEDNFNLILFNDEVLVFGRTPMKANLKNVEGALSFIKSGYLSGGTDFTKSLSAALLVAKQFSQSPHIIMVSDGNPTLGSVSMRKIVDGFQKANRSKIRLYLFGIGSDTNLQLLKELAQISDGYFDWARETDEVDFKLRALFEKIGQSPIVKLKLESLESSESSQKANFYRVYPDVDLKSYDGSLFAFVGRYRKPLKSVNIAISGERDGRQIRLSKGVSLPEFDDEHSDLPRIWAKARVEALLREISLKGERAELINEVIALSKKYKFVTPYTSFLAAPRSLLRPRIIKPGDPVLRLRTDPLVVSVVAVFPFGFTKKLTYLKDEDVWETRFLAPKNMADGSYRCRLILIDKKGRAYQEEKSFMIDSRPPTLKAKLSRQTASAGEEVFISIKADKDTRRIVARLFGAQPAPIIWDEKLKINRGRLRIPHGLPSGIYSLSIWAEDFAHNSASLDLKIEVLGQL